MGSGHSEGRGVAPYMDGQVTNSRHGKSAHLINLCTCGGTLTKVDVLHVKYYVANGYQI